MSTVSNNSDRKKVFIIVPPVPGHVNPISGLIHELTTRGRFACVLYGNEEYREKIEATGAQFRLYSHPNLGEIARQREKHAETSNDDQMILINKTIDYVYELMPQLVDDCERDRPDLIIYDMTFMPAKCLLKVLESRYRKGLSRVRPPKSLQFMPSFAINWKIVNEAGIGMKKDFGIIVGMFKVFMRFIYLSWHFSISYNIWNMMDAHPNLNIVAVFPELQPCRDQFGATYKFVGPTISEQARSIETTTSEKLKTILDEIAPQNNDVSKPSNSNLKLIYVSMGTVPSNSLHVFEKTIKAIDELSSKMAANYKMKAIFSVGSGNLKKLEDKIANGEIVCPENVILCAKVPQLEVLKRADLFITHCGMNSTSEAINYGVPVVCIPLEADQPMVAKRICDDLELGKRLDAKVMSVNGLVEALNEVLTNEKYKVNMVEMSKVSAKYNGLVEGRKIIENYLNLVEVS